MLLFTMIMRPANRTVNRFPHKCYKPAFSSRLYSETLENKYSEVQKEKILEVINSDKSTLQSYNIPKSRLNKIFNWINNNGKLNNISQLENIEGFTEKYVQKLYNSILDGSIKNKVTSNKVKGQILHPSLEENIRKKCKSVLAVNISVNSVCWTLMDRNDYKLLEWKYHGIDYRDEKKLNITDIYNIAWRVTQSLPQADLYVMKAESTTLRAAGSDPNNPKIISVNLQKSQMVAMIVALINSRDYSTLESDNDDADQLPIISQKVYFLRPSLPFRLYGTLIGSERVSTDQTVELLLQNTDGSTKAQVPDYLKAMFRSQKDLEKDMLGQCLLLGLTFMDICIYRNAESIIKINKRSS